MSTEEFIVRSQGHISQPLYRNRYCLVYSWWEYPIATTCALGHWSELLKLNYNQFFGAISRELERSKCVNLFGHNCIYMFIYIYKVPFKMFCVLCFLAIKHSIWGQIWWFIVWMYSFYIQKCSFKKM